MLISDFFQLVVENVCALTLIMWPRFNETKSENNRLPDHCTSLDYVTKKRNDNLWTTIKWAGGQDVMGRKLKLSLPFLWGCHL